MPVTAVSESIFQTKVGTEHTLTSVVSAGVFVLNTSVQSMIANDMVTFRVKSVVMSAQPLGLVYRATYQHSMSYDPIKSSVPITSMYRADFTLECNSSGAASSGVGSNGPVIAWRVDNVS